MIVREVPVNCDLSLFAVRIVVREAAVELGFDWKAREELAIVASELASNIVKHARCGTFIVDAASHSDYGGGIRLIAADDGPLIRDLATAIQDGYDDCGPIHPERMASRRGLGIGLGAVARLTDSLEIEPCLVGKKVRAVRYLRRPRRSQGSMAMAKTHSR